MLLKTVCFWRLINKLEELKNRSLMTRSSTTTKKNAASCTWDKVAAHRCGQAAIWVAAIWVAALQEKYRGVLASHKLSCQ